MQRFAVHYQRAENNTIDEQEESGGPEHGYLYKDCGKNYRHVGLGSKAHCLNIDFQDMMQHGSLV